MRMLQTGGRLDLGEKTFRAECGCQIGMQNLDGNVALVPQVVRAIDRRHPTRADLPVYPIAVLQRRGEPRDDIAHPDRAI